MFRRVRAALVLTTALAVWETVRRLRRTESQLTAERAAHRLVDHIVYTDLQ